MVRDTALDDDGRLRLGAYVAPLPTVGRVLQAIGLGRLKNLKPAEPVRRHQWARPGDMIHVDTKQPARFERVGHRITGDRRLGCSRGAGYEKAQFNALALIRIHQGKIDRIASLMFSQAACAALQTLSKALSATAVLGFSVGFAEAVLEASFALALIGRERGVPRAMATRAGAAIRRIVAPSCLFISLLREHYS